MIHEALAANAPSCLDCYAKMELCDRHLLKSLVYGAWDGHRIANLIALIQKYGPVILPILIAVLDAQGLALPGWVDRIIQAMIQVAPNRVDVWNVTKPI
jgi:hypothetical protein